MSELDDYYHFSGPQRRDKALHTLRGILEGVIADHRINEKEFRELDSWLSAYEPLGRKCPAFVELATATRAAMADGIFTSEEIEDLKALTARLLSTSGYFGAVTHAIQELHGMLHGVLADGVVVRDELAALRDFLEEHEHMRGVWPLTEIDTIVTAALTRELSSEQRAQLKFFFSQFTHLTVNHPKPAAPVDLNIMAVCATAPEITFPRRFFCFTGICTKMPRRAVHEIVAKHGGFPRDNVTREIDYLVVHETANPCWAYSCYGRKIEEAVHLRMEGMPIQIVQERDFWDAIG